MPERIEAGTVPPDRSTVIGLKDHVSTNRIVTVDSESLTRENPDQTGKRISVLDKLSNEPIRIDINSRGGKFETALRLHILLRQIHSPVLGFVNGECESAAVLVLLGCKFRGATANSSIMIHEPFIKRGKRIFRSSDIRNENQSDVERSIYALLDSKKEQLLSILSEATGSPKELWEGIMREGISMTGHDALGVGLIHAVI